MTGGQPAKHIIVRLGRKKRRFTLVAPPYPEEGDQIKLDDGRHWEVISVEDTHAWTLPPIKKADL